MQEKDGPKRYYLSLDGLTYAEAHPERYGLEDSEECMAIVQQGIAWLNGEP